MEPTSKEINKKINELSKELGYAWWHDMQLDLEELSWLQYWTEEVIDLQFTSPLIRREHD